MRTIRAHKITISGHVMACGEGYPTQKGPTTTRRYWVSRRDGILWVAVGGPYKSSSAAKEVYDGIE